jgi:hypothetical protein
MNYMMHKMMNRGIGSFMNSGGSNIGGMTSAISELQNGINNNNQHELLQMVQQNTGIQDPSQAQLYTQHALGLLNEHANNNPQGLSAILGNFMGGNNQGQQFGAQQQQQGDLGGLANELGF